MKGGKGKGKGKAGGGVLEMVGETQHFPPIPELYICRRRRSAALQ